MNRARYHNLVRITAAVVITLLFTLHSAGRWTWSPLERLDALAYDARLRYFLEPGIDPRIVIVDVDEASLQELGHWPWHRDVLAQLVERLNNDYNTALIGFDMVFAEADDNSGLAVLETLERRGLSRQPELAREAQRLRAGLQFDERFARALQGRPVVLGFFFQSQQSGGTQLQSSGQLPTAITVAPALPAGVELVEASGYGANLPRLQSAALGGGFIDIPQMDEDGVIRRVVLLQQYGGRLYPSLSLAMMMALVGNPSLQLITQDYGADQRPRLEEVRLAEGMGIPVNEFAAALVPYRHPYPAFHYVSAVDVVRGRVDKGVLENSIVLVGTTAAGLLDNRNTPVQSVHPGVEVHASLLAGILDQRVMHQPAYSRGVDILALCLLAVVLAWWLPRLGALGTLLLSGALALAALLVNMLLWRELQWVLPIAAQLGLVASLYIFYSSYGFFTENRAKRALTQRFGQYVPPEIVEEMSNTPLDLDYGMQGQVRHMSVMFSDIRGFTHIADTLLPTQLAQLMNIYLTHMTQTIHQHRGTIDKYIGDAIMAFWGAPLDDPLHARHAIEAAFDMLARMEQVNVQLQRRDLPSLGIGIGINTGEMSVGNMGSSFRMAYTVLGDAVNLASRFETLTKHYHVPIIVSEYTQQVVTDYSFRILDKVKFTGREKAVTLYEPICRSSELSVEKRGELEEYHLALQAYYQQEWAVARRRFQALCERYPNDPVYTLYASRVVQLQQQPHDPTWDKTWLHDTVKQVLD